MNGASNRGNIYNTIYRTHRTMDDANMRALNSQLLELMGLKHGRSYVMIVHATNNENMSKRWNT